MNKPSWDDAPEWAQWLAMDSNGQWFWRDAEPIAEGVFWYPLFAGVLYANSTAPKSERAGWKNTLEPRP